MTGFNMPPGCNVSDIPGNRPEDIALENAEEHLLEELAKENLRPYEYEIVLRAGIASIKEFRKVIEDARSDKKLWEVMTKYENPL